MLCRSNRRATDTIQDTAGVALKSLSRTVFGIAKALQRRVIRVSEMFEEHRSSGDARPDVRSGRYSRIKGKNMCFEF